MSKKIRINLRDKVMTKVFVDRVEEFIALWKRESPDIAFEEFLITVPFGNAELKVLEKALARSFQRVVQLHVDLWKNSGSEKTFDEFLCLAKSSVRENNEKGGKRR